MTRRFVFFAVLANLWFLYCYGACHKTQKSQAAPAPRKAEPPPAAPQGALPPGDYTLTWGSTVVPCRLSPASEWWCDWPGSCDYAGVWEVIPGGFRFTEERFKKDPSQGFGPQGPPSTYTVGLAPGPNGSWHGRACTNTAVSLAPLKE